MNQNIPVDISQYNMSKPMTGFTVSPAPARLVKWCDTWHKKALKAGLNKTKLFAKTITQPNNTSTSYGLTLLVIGRAPYSVNWGAHSLEAITEQELREATAYLIDLAKKDFAIPPTFDFEY
jgi:hypothetical protein